MEEKGVMEWTGFYKKMTDRNIGVVSLEEQERLRKGCVAVAGCGGMGGLSAEQLVRLGVGHLKIADFDNFEIHNLSRQCGSTSSNIGKNKAEVLARYFRKINPELKLDVFKKGVQEENVEEFVEGSEAVIDSIDYGSFYNSVLLSRAARKRNLCVVSPSAIGFGVNVIVFGPKTVSIEEYVGVPADASKETVKNFTMPIEKFAVYLPTYADMDIAKKAALGMINIPNLIMPQHLGTSIAVTEVVLLILGRVAPPEGPKPRIFILDVQDRKFEMMG